MNTTKAKDKVGLVDLLMTLSGLSIPLIISQSKVNYFSTRHGSSTQEEIRDEICFYCKELRRKKAIVM